MRGRLTHSSWFESLEMAAKDYDDCESIEAVGLSDAI